MRKRNLIYLSLIRELLEVGDRIKINGKDLVIIYIGSTVESGIFKTNDGDWWFYDMITKIEDEEKNKKLQTLKILYTLSK
jgi:hypothetical protein